jgi:hypothetical protein
MLNKYGWRQPVILMAQPGVEPLDLEIRCKDRYKKRDPQNLVSYSDRLGQTFGQTAVNRLFVLGHFRTIIASCDDYALS